MGRRPSRAAVGGSTEAAQGPSARADVQAASLWEIAIKNTLGREDFQVDPRLLRRGLLDNGYVESPFPANTP